MNKTNLPHAAALLRRRSLGTAIAVALAGVLAAPAQAFEFELGESWTGNLDTTVSYGIAQRTVGPADDLIGKGNFNPLIGTQSNAAQRAALGRFSVNSDDGNLNYGESGDIISNAFKITSELGISNSDDSFGLFTRATYFYDFENVDKAFLSQAALDKVGKRFRFLDAFVFHNFELGEMTGNVRLGQQVVSWGESTFIQNGINVINPVDVSQLRVAGAELKEAFLPVNMIYGSLNFSENLSAEAFYLFEFEQTEPEPVGSYFSTNDFAALGGTYVMLGFGTSPQPVRNPELFYDVCGGRRPTDNPAILGLPAAQQAQALAIACGSAVQRLPDRTPDGDGQYGLALRYFSPELNDTEFGFYFMNYHSRLPLLSGVSVTNSSANSGRFFVEYPEDIRLYGLSFNTTIPGPGIALQGEVSYRDNMPLQFDDVELLFTALSPLNAVIPAPVNRFVSQLGSVGPGQTVRGWERHEVAQWQVTATKTFANVLGADLVAVVGEAGGTRVNDLPETSVLRYQGDGTDTGGGPDFLTGALRNPITQTTGFPTRYSWGYRVAGRAEYNDVFAGVNLIPRVAFNHDVNGITPGPGGNFIEGRRSTTLGVEANYLNQWAADLAYTRFFGAGNLNLVRDRDFLAFTVRYSF
jgi:hypothetical protein